MKCLLLTILIGLLCGYVSCRPQGSAASAKGGAAPGTSEGLPLSWLMSAMPKTGIAGLFDNMGAAMANFGNAQGAGFDAFLSGIFSGIGVGLSGLFGSGAINTGRSYVVGPYVSKESNPKVFSIFLSFFILKYMFLLRSIPQL